MLYSSMMHVGVMLLYSLTVQHLHAVMWYVTV